MNLRYVVPALGIIAFSNVAFAADSGVTIGGFVDTLYTVSNTEDDSTGVDYSGFAAAAEVRLGYKVGDQVGAQVDVEWNNNLIESFDMSDDNTHGDVYLEQAYVNYAFADKLSLTTGKFTTYAGWVAADADGLYRISSGPIVSLYGGELIGAALNWAPSDNLAISFFVVNGLDVIEDDSANGDFADDTDDRDRFVSPAVDIVFKAPDLGTFNVEFGYDYLGSDVDLWSLGLNATIKPKAYEALTLGAEVLLQRISDDSGAFGNTDRMGALLMVNHAIPLGIPASVTLMGQHVESRSAEDFTNREIALALLTNPTGDAKFGVNAEIAAGELDENLGGGNNNNDDSVAISLEAIAVIP